MPPPTEDELALIRGAMSRVRLPTAYDKVYNDECMLSFDTPFSPTGLYVNMNSFHGVGEPFLARDHERSGAASNLYLHLRATRFPKPQRASEASDEARGPSRMAIGGEGGFQVEEDKYDVVKEQALLLMPQRVRVSLPAPELPEIVNEAGRTLAAKTSCLAEEKVAAVAWEAEVKPSKYADDLIQLPPHKQISPDPSTWVCEESGMRENLWLNLSDGHIGSGRRQWDGSGGANGALNHYKETMKHFPPSGFPLVVKLGTITPHGADVYSYAEDEDTEVSDPKLAEHLAHWGINMLRMEKTEKSVAEMNIEANEKLELDTITEAGRELVPVTGAGFIGMRNLGNSCYLNSVMQVLFALPEYAALWSSAQAIFESAASEPTDDLLVQLSKLASALLTPRYAIGGPGADPSEFGDGGCVPPRMLKNLIGKGHAEFSSARQQDALEFYQHFLQVLQRAERTGGGRLTAEAPLSRLFAFTQEERVACDGMVAYRDAEAQWLSLPIPVDQAANRAEVAAYEERSREKRQKVADGTEKEADKEEPVVAIVSFEACLAKAAAAEPLEVFRGRSGASRTTRFKTFPRYLVVHMQRYYQDTDWTAKKLSVRVPAPETLDLTALRGSGLQDGETPMPEEQADPSPAAADPPAPAVQPEEAIVVQLMSMGFSENGSKRAALAVNNTSAESAMEWVFAHLEDPDFNDPLPPPGQEPAPAPSTAENPEATSMLEAMGFAPQHARGALAATSGNVERAADWLFSHMDDLDKAVAEALGQGGTPAPGEAAVGDSTGSKAPEDGSGVYELVGFVSHMGANTSCGHYVCHIKKEGKWTIFNDRKVAISEATPLDLGYMYFFRSKPSA